MSLNGTEQKIQGNWTTDLSDEEVLTRSLNSLSTGLALATRGKTTEAQRPLGKAVFGLTELENRGNTDYRLYYKRGTARLGLHHDLPAAKADLFKAMESIPGEIKNGFAHSLAQYFLKANTIQFPEYAGGEGRLTKGTLALALEFNEKAIDTDQLQKINAAIAAENKICAKALVRGKKEVPDVSIIRPQYTLEEAKLYL